MCDNENCRGGKIPVLNYQCRVPNASPEQAGAVHHWADCPDCAEGQRTLEALRIQLDGAMRDQLRLQNRILFFRERFQAAISKLQYELNNFEVEFSPVVPLDADAGKELHDTLKKEPGSRLPLNKGGAGVVLDE